MLARMFTNATKQVSPVPFPHLGTCSTGPRGNNNPGGRRDRPPQARHDRRVRQAGRDQRSMVRRAPTEGDVLCRGCWRDDGRSVDLSGRCCCFRPREITLKARN